MFKSFIKQFTDNLKHLYKELGPVFGTVIIILNLVMFTLLFGVMFWLFKWVGILVAIAITAMTILFAPLETACMEDRAKQCKCKYPRYGGPW